MKLIKKLTKLVNTVNGTLYDGMRKDLEERASWLDVKIDYKFPLQFSNLIINGYPKTGEVNQIHINLRMAMTPLEEIVDIAHEMGHVWQFYSECMGDFAEWMVYRELNHVMLIEQDAWIRSVRLLHEVGFEDWKIFRALAIRKFATYVHVSIDEDEARRARVVEFAMHLDQEVSKVMAEPIYA
jgi:hypothetical protein